MQYILIQNYEIYRMPLLIHRIENYYFFGKNYFITDLILIKFKNVYLSRFLSHLNVCIIILIIFI